jgi:plasmid stabilization system protein ParE
LKYWLHPEAERDLELVIERYVNRFGSAAASRFVAEYERVRDLIVGNPELGTKTTRGRRTYPFKAMPYLLVYRAEDTGLVILIVRHQHRNPRLGSRRN